VAFTLAKMNNPGDIIDSKYSVVEILSSEGGMGELLKVHAVSDPSQVFALKYCMATEAEPLDRFRREIRIMQEFTGNSKVVQILDSNLSHTPPYFVMPIYSDGDLRSLSPAIKTDSVLQEATMLGMCDCVDELHKSQKFHRDIKPANFLREADKIVIADFGLGTDLLSRTGVTLTNQWGGTQGYVPPEFLVPDGFKNATPQADIFMLGKTFYNLVTELDPQYIDKSQLSKPLFYLIERCCAMSPSDRIQTVSELKQSIVNTYDIILGRLDPYGEAKAEYDGILQLLKQGQYRVEALKKFISLLEGVSSAQFFSIVGDADKPFFFILSQTHLQSELSKFLDLYDVAIREEDFLSFSYAEHIADRMEVLFMNCSDPDLQVKALELAIIHAERFNRFAAMSTCSDIITGIHDNILLEQAVVALIIKHRETFIANIEASTCKSPMIADQISKISDS
jgi:serine/threonine protein kinase